MQRWNADVRCQGTAVSHVTCTTCNQTASIASDRLHNRIARETGRLLGFARTCCFGTPRIVYCSCNQVTVSFATIFKSLQPPWHTRVALFLPTHPLPSHAFTGLSHTSINSPRPARALNSRCHAPLGRHPPCHPPSRILHPAAAALAAGLRAASCCTALGSRPTRCPTLSRARRVA